MFSVPNTGGRGDRVICDCMYKGQTTGDRGVRDILYWGLGCWGQTRRGARCFGQTLLGAGALGTDLTGMDARVY